MSDIVEKLQHMANQIRRGGAVDTYWEADRLDTAATMLAQLRASLAAAEARAVKAEEERDEWREVAQRWTPGGSEFTEPHEVAAHYARRFKEHHEGMKALVRRRREVEAERDAALRKLAELEAMIPPRPEDAERLIWMMKPVVVEPFPVVDDAAKEGE